MISELVKVLPTASVGMATGGSKEDSHWRTVENRKSETGQEGVEELGEDYWSQLECTISESRLSLVGK